MSDLEMFRGDTEQFFLSISRNEVPVDLNDAKIWMTGRRSQGASALFIKTSDMGGGIEITDASGGLATVTMSNTDTAGLSSEVVTLVYDVQVRESSGRISTVFSGNLVVKPDVTLET